MSSNGTYTLAAGEPRYTDAEKERAVNIFTDCIEGGGSNYWAEHKEYDHAGGELAAFDLATVDVLDQEDGDGEWVTVTPEKIAYVLRRVARDEYAPFYNAMSYDTTLAERLRGEPDDFDYDAGDTDSVLQLIVLDGSIEYG